MSLLPEAMRHWSDMQLHIKCSRCRSLKCIKCDVSQEIIFWPFKAGWRIYASVNSTVIGAYNGLSPGHRQAIIYMNQWWFIVNWTHRNKFQWNFDKNLQIFIQENEFQNVSCKIPQNDSHFDGLVQERHYSIVNALELCLSCTNPSICLSLNVLKWPPFCDSLNKLLWYSPYQ